MGQTRSKTTTQEGGAGSNNRSAKTAQHNPQGAHHTSRHPPDLSVLIMSQFCWLPTPVGMETEPDFRALAHTDLR